MNPFLTFNSDSNHLTLSDCLPDKPKHVTTNESHPLCGWEHEAAAICAGILNSVV